VQKRKRSFAVVAENFLEELVGDQNAFLRANRVSNEEFLKCDDKSLNRKLHLFKIKPKSA
jgi:hypothetical protein